jgi:hypothetical protein
MKTPFGLLALPWWLACATLAQDQGAHPSQAPPAKPLITRAIQQAIDAGLAFLAKQQAGDGSWGTRGYKGHVAVTSLAGFAYLSAGHRPGQGPHGQTVAKALDYVLMCGGKKHVGLPAGFFLWPSFSLTGAMYGHGYAVQFLAEALAAVGGKKQEAVKEALTRGVKIILDAQNKEGGWRYRPEPRDADLSVTCCQLHALLAAKRAGIEVPQEVLDKALRYVRSCYDATAGNFRYQPQAGKSNYAFALCAAAVSVLAIAKADEDEPFTKGLAYLKARPGGDAAYGGIYFCYGHYYAAQAMSHRGGKDWETWYPGARESLLSPRPKRGPDSSWPGPYCTHLNTALAVLTLQMPDSRLTRDKR